MRPAYFPLALWLSTVAAQQFYPLTRKNDIPTAIEPYAFGDTVLVDCIQRNIDNGEHKFDDQQRIIYGPFPTCKETGKPLQFRYGVNEDINCTIGFTDELYHLFQLYIHEDAPFTCRVPFSKERNYLEKGGAHIPLTFNLRGEVHDSHVDVDSSVNVILTTPSNGVPQQNTFVSAVAWSSGTNATRVVIGEYLTLQLAVRWYSSLLPVDGNANFKDNGLPYYDGFYKLPMAFVPISYTVLYVYLGLVAAAASAVSLGFGYNFINLRLTRNSYRSLDTESHISKRD